MYMPNSCNRSLATKQFREKHSADNCLFYDNPLCITCSFCTTVIIRWHVFSMATYFWDSMIGLGVAAEDFAFAVRFRHTHPVYFNSSKDSYCCESPHVHMLLKEICKDTKPQRGPFLSTTSQLVTFQYFTNNLIYISTLTIFITLLVAILVCLFHFRKYRWRTKMRVH